MISVSRRWVNEILDLLGFYAALIDILYRCFGITDQSRQIGCPKTSVKTINLYCVWSQNKEDLFNVGIIVVYYNLEIRLKVKKETLALIQCSGTLKHVFLAKVTLSAVKYACYSKKSSSKENTRS
jgi:hypothetical protein